MRKTKKRIADPGTMAKPVTTEFIHSLRGKYKHMGLMKALMEERKKARAANS